VTGNPYPGLRAFEKDDAHLFFGREKQVREVVSLLALHRFLAVVGVPGSGKSSLVKAGLLPALHLGTMGEDFPDWRVAVMTPAGDPLGELCKALGGGKALGPDPDCRTLLESTSRGLIERTLCAGLEDGTHLLVVVDQFEEIFRYRKDRAEGPDQSARFVRLLLDATGENQKWARIYVLMTMRSDFLGDCAEFLDLPEALNKGQFLVPRMTRDERREAIERPARAAGAEIEASLVERLLNDAGDEASQLPVLQHTLRRTFAEFERAGAAGAINLGHYEAAGKLKDALNRHAEALLDDPQDPAGGWTGKVFRCLTTMQGGRKVRRPTELSLLYDVVGARDDEKKELVRKVIQRYADPDCAMVALKGPDDAGRMIADISHESLIANWTRLDQWVDAEANAVRVYLAAADDVLHYAEAGAQWRGAKLDEALAYVDPERGTWNQAWAGRLAAGAPYERVCDFLKAQKAGQAADEKKEEAQHAKDLAAEQQARKDAEARAAAQARAKRWLIAAVIFLLAAAVAAVGFAVSSGRAAEAQRRATEAQRRAAEAQNKLNALDAALQKKDQETDEVRRQLGEANLSATRKAELEKLLADKGRETEALKRRREEAEGKVSAGTRTVAELTQTLAELKARADLDRTAAQKTITDLQSALKKANDESAGYKRQIAEYDQKLLESAAELERVKGRVNPKDGLTYVWIPPLPASGTFIMGCSPGDTQCDSDEKPPHAEQIANGFWLGQTEVTQAAWKKVNGGENPSHFRGDQLPVESVDWNQASAYCKAIGGRLPTEKEWEYAARAGTTGARYGPIDAIAWYSGNSSATTHPVGLKLPNAFRLYDMLGNVWEWTADDYAGEGEVVRGGSWVSGSEYVRASVRSRDEPSGRGNFLGFRCVGEFR
jgi:formylglycine-generating enzyme required for sulfatase activity